MKLRKLAAVLLAICIVVSSFPVSTLHVHAEEVSAVSDFVYEDFTYQVDNDAITITGYTGTAAEIVVPAVIEGKPVTNIGNEAFYDCRSLESIILPDSITSIGNVAFYGCSALTDITIPSKVTSIGLSTFWGCSSLERIVIPENVTSIGDAAFLRCSNLTEIEFPEGLKSIGVQTFYNCEKLTKIVIPGSVESISSSAFENCSGLAEIIFNGTAPSFAENCFYGVEAAAYYPANDPTWTEGVKQGYGGSITWAVQGETPDEEVCVHEWVDATCTVPKTCTLCGETEGEALGHDEIEHEAKTPTCDEIGWEAYVTCSRCDYTTYAEKQPEHTWAEISCDLPKTCSLCGETEGKALGHDEIEHEAKTTTCDEIGWEAYVTCSRCDYTTYAEKQPEHTWAEASCDLPKTCTLCGETEGEALGHSFENGVCSVCGLPNNIPDGLEYAVYTDYV